MIPEFLRQTLWEDPQKRGKDHLELYDTQNRNYQTKEKQTNS